MKARIHRSDADRVIGGVAAGIAQRFDWSTTLTRVVMVAAALVSFATAILTYLAAWIVMPTRSGLTVAGAVESTSQNSGGASVARSSGSNGTRFLGVLLVSTGLLFISVTGAASHWIGGGTITALVFIALGGAILLRR